MIGEGGGVVERGGGYCLSEGRSHCQINNPVLVCLFVCLFVCLSPVFCGYK